MESTTPSEPTTFCPVTITSLDAAFAQAPDPRLSQLVEPGLGVQHDADVLEGVRRRAGGATGDGIAPGIVGVAVLDGAGAVHQRHDRTEPVVQVVVGTDRAT